MTITLPPRTSAAHELLRIDPADAAAAIESGLRATVQRQLRKRGVVVGLSGGIDSSVVAALCARAFGPERVLALLMPERESSGDSTALGRMAAEAFGIPVLVEDITPVLVAAGCYRRRDDAIRTLIPEYADDWKCKIALPSVLQDDRARIFTVIVRSPEGEERRARVTPAAYLELIAATSLKQRTRKMMEYLHADRLGFAVAGTPNRLEYDQGFFVKNGDGAADVKPIAHLYKTQVYALADYLGVPATIRERPPTTDTYSLPQSQEEFYFSLPYGAMDVCLYAHNHGLPASAVAAELELTEQQVERVFRDIEAKRAATRPLHLPPLLMEPVAEVHD